MFALSILWATLATALIVLAVYRKVAARGEDDVIHVRDVEVAVIGKQSSLAKTLDVIDHWGKTLTVIVVAYGLALLGSYLYMSWEQSQLLSVR
jgi:hypothetical protein